MKYIGNKNRLLGFIFESICDAKIPIEGVFIDIFGGTGSVGKFFKEKGMSVISNDIMSYSYVAQYVLIGLNQIPCFEKVSTTGLEGVLNMLNNPALKKKGYIYDNFAPGGSAKRKYFSDENAQRIDAVRDLIEEWYIDGRLTRDEYYVLVYSLVDAADFVANIAGTYGAYLKIWRSMALKPLTLLPPNIFNNSKNHIVFQKDANHLVKHVRGDILYIDPPYNTRQYAPNFHVLETLTVWDKQQLTGKCGQRDYSNKKSLYCSKKEATNALKDLVLSANVKYVVLSYNNEGIISRDDILYILSLKGDVYEYTQVYRRFRTEKDNEHRHYKECDDKVAEHLYVVKVRTSLLK